MPIRQEETARRLRLKARRMPECFLRETVTPSKQQFSRTDANVPKGPGASMSHIESLKRGRRDRVMITIDRSLMLVSALAAAALVVTLETSHTRAANAPVSEQVAHRFPLPSEMLTPVPLTTYMAPKFIAAQKGAAAQTPRPTRIQSCANTPNGWPYVSHACLVG
jgi:hypothetical protein